jgi:hypothetical protein
MEKILNEASVTPRITLTQDEYNRLVALARANAKQIEQRAVEYYKKNGVCSIHIDAYVREYNGASNEIADTYRFDCQPQYGYVMPSGEYEANPFAIDRETRQRIMKFAASFATAAFYRKFGKQLMHINNAERYERRARNYMTKCIVITVTGWLLAVALFLVAVLK